jgi:hypothetical protein
VGEISGKASTGICSHARTIHFHILFLDGVYVYRDNRTPRFQRVKAPDISELENLVQLISQRVGRYLERQGLLGQDAEQAWLDLDPADDTDAMPHLLGSSVSYRIAVGPQQGQKAFMIRTIRPLDRPEPELPYLVPPTRAPPGTLPLFSGKESAFS